MKTLVPLNWQPTPKTQEWAAELLQDVKEFIETYITTCHAKGIKYANHDMAFRNWVKMAIERRPGLKRLPEKDLLAHQAPALPVRTPAEITVLLKRISADEFWDVYAAAGKPKGFARKLESGEYTWDRKPADMVVRGVGDVR